MSIEVRAGTRLRSVACATEVVVVRVEAGTVDLRCGGHAMRLRDDPTEEHREILPPFDGGTALGKRYVDEAQTIEVLCTHDGAGSLSIGDVPLVLKTAKPLPASD